MLQPGNCLHYDKRQDGPARSLTDKQTGAPVGDSRVQRGLGLFSLLSISREATSSTLLLGVPRRTRACVLAMAASCCSVASGPVHTVWQPGSRACMCGALKLVYSSARALAALAHPGQVLGLCAGQGCDRAAQSLQVCQAQLLGALVEASLRQRCLLPAKLCCLSVLVIGVHSAGAPCFTWIRVSGSCWIGARCLQACARQAPGSLPQAAVL